MFYPLTTCVYGTLVWCATKIVVMQAKVLSIIFATEGKDGLFYTGFRASVSGVICAYKICTEKPVSVGDVFPYELLEKLAPRG